MDEWQRFKQSWRTTSNWNKLLVLLTAVIAVSNGCYSCYARKQFVIMGGTLTEMKRSGQQSTEQVWRAIDNMNWMARSMDWSQKGAQAAMDNSDQLAKRSLNATVNQFQIDQRAWLGVSQGPVDYSNLPAIGISIAISNTGRSPAFNVIQIPNRGNPVMAGSGDFIAYREPIPDIPYPLGTFPPGLVINPGFKLPTEKLNPTIPGNIVSTDSKARYIGVYSGRITYEDVFHHFHWTGYCYYWSTPLPYTGRNTRTNFCPYGNDTDDSPQKPPSRGEKVFFP